MIYSMTGFAAGAAELETGSLILEVRSVNHRYLDLQLKMPDELRVLEPPLREAIAARLARGKAECRIGFSAHQGRQAAARLNAEMLQQLARWSGEVRAVLPQAASLSVADVLRWNGVLESAVLPAEALQEAVMALLQRVLADFSAAREREGEKLAEYLLQRVTQIEAVCAAVAPRIPAAIAAYEARLGARLREALQGGDEERLRQEVAVFASRVDVEEELSRLRAHLQEVRRVLGQGGAVGKRLDFMMQELNREANTLGSKSVDVEVSRASMEMKLLIEQMREQIQNIE